MCHPVEDIVGDCMEKSENDKMERNLKKEKFLEKKLNWIIINAHNIL